MVFKICVKNRSNICCSNTKVSASVRRCFSFLIDVFVVLPIPQILSVETKLLAIYSGGISIHF
ncbi:hypothetical protein CFP56_027033 [Quercus suber]|uniref:Uncharacterized protein n=1 Tax=Quercus suber TaxID=58331 RepID=A0AAW0JXS0_QUESU